MEEQVLPSLMDIKDEEDVVQKVLKHAKYFSVIRYVRGGFQMGRATNERYERPNLEEARALALQLREEDSKNTVIIYGVADFVGAKNVSRPVEFFPKVDYQSRRDKDRAAKAERQAAKERLREARLNLGSKHSKPKPALAPTGIPEDFEDASEPLAFVTDD